MTIIASLTTLYAYLKSVVQHDLDEGVPQPRDLDAVFDLLDEDGGVDVRADVVEEDVHEVGLVDGVVDQRSPQLLVVVLLAELHGAIDVRQLLNKIRNFDQLERSFIDILL